MQHKDNPFCNYAEHVQQRMNHPKYKAQMDAHLRATRIMNSLQSKNLEDLKKEKIDRHTLLAERQDGNCVNYAIGVYTLFDLAISTKEQAILDYIYETLFQSEHLSTQEHLYWAISCHQPETELKRWWISASEMDTGEYRPLEAAARYGCVHALQILLEQGASPNFAGWSHDAVDVLIVAFKHRQLEAIRFLISQDLKYLSNVHQSLLVTVIENGSAEDELTRLLVESHLPDLNKSGRILFTNDYSTSGPPLYFAAAKEDQNLCAYLISKGAQPALAIEAAKELYGDKYEIQMRDFLSRVDTNRQPAEVTSDTDSTPQDQEVSAQPIEKIYENYTKRAQDTLADNRQESSDKTPHDLSLTQHLALLFFSDHLQKSTDKISVAVAGESAKSVNKTKELQTDLQHLLTTYKQSWWVSSARKKQAETLRQSIHSLAELAKSKATRPPYKDMLQKIQEAKLIAMQNDQEQNKNAWFFMQNRKGYSRYYHTLNQMQNVVLGKFATDYQALRKFKTYRQHLDQEVENVLGMLHQETDLLFANKNFKSYKQFIKQKSLSFFKKIRRNQNYDMLINLEELCASLDKDNPDLLPEVLKQMSTLSENKNFPGHIKALINELQEPVLLLSRAMTK